MAEISAGMVKELRELTGLGMMECKKALTESNGDIKAAEDLLRIKSGAKANKLAGRIAAEGIIGVFVSPDKKTGALVEVNCETDFVAKDENFIGFVNKLVTIIAQANPENTEALSALTYDGQTLEEARKALIMKIGENVSIRRFTRYQTQGQIAAYRHGSRIGVLVNLQGGDEQLGKDLAMHIAASKPICVSSDQVSAEVLAKEKEIYTAQAAESGKPSNIIEKMVEGRIVKFLAEVTLLGQPFVKNPEITIEKLLASKSAKVNAFQMYIVGEGIEKKTVDFAAEVAAAAAV